MKPNSIVRLVLPDVQELLREGSQQDVADALAPFHSADIADLVEELEGEDAKRLLLGLSPEQRVEVFEQLEQGLQVELFEQLPADEGARIVSDMAADDRADLIGELPGEVVSRVLGSLSAEEAKDVATLVNYEEETAGGIMTSEFVRLSPDMTVSEALERVREQATSKETIYALFVLDDQHRLLGVVSLSQLVLTRPRDAKVGEIMYDNPISVSVGTDQETVMRQLRHYDFLAMPVLDDQGRMVGIVTHDDALDVAVEEADEDAQRMGGVEPLEAPYLSTALLTLVRKRALWLTLLLLAELIGGTVLRSYEATLERSLALIFFLPLIIASGGNSGSQSATLVIRGLAVGELGLRDWWLIARREIGAGLLLGVLLGALGVGIAHVWGQPAIASTVFITLVLVVLGGSLLGSLLPLTLARVGIDPAITSSPLVASLVDVFGVLTYVLVAGALLP